MMSIISESLVIDPSGITISGFSSGAGFALQQQVAFSSVYSGVGVFSGEIPHCSVMYWPNVSELVNGTNHDCPLCDGCPDGTTLKDCSCPADIQPARVVDFFNMASGKGTIDAIAHLNGTRVWVHQGSSEGWYSGGQHERNLAQIFEAFGSAVVATTTQSNHAWPLDGHGTPCGLGHSYLEDCHFDGPGAMLNHLYGPLNPPAKRYDPAGLVHFDQRPFFSPDNDGTLGAGLAPNGFIYLPTSCRAPNVTKCRLHMSLHGCGERGYYDLEVRKLGFLEWGESNGVWQPVSTSRPTPGLRRASCLALCYSHHKLAVAGSTPALLQIVVLFPQVHPHGTTWQEQSGCFDTYGQKGKDYDAKSGVQMHALRSMIAAVAGL